MTADLKMWFLTKIALARDVFGDALDSPLDKSTVDPRITACFPDSKSWGALMSKKISIGRAEELERMTACFIGEAEEAIATFNKEKEKVGLLCIVGMDHPKPGVLIPITYGRSKRYFLMYLNADSEDGVAFGATYDSKYAEYYARMFLQRFYEWCAEEARAPAKLSLSPSRIRSCHPEAALSAFSSCSAAP